MKKIYKLALFFIAILVITACKVDEDKNKEETGTVEDLENQGLIPSNLDRTTELLGIDSNNSGVRDDVEKYIKEKFPNQISEAMQFAKALQGKFKVDLTNKLAVREASLQSVRGINCLYIKNRIKRLDSNLDLVNPDRIFDEVISITTNTKERLTTYLKFSSAMSGSVLPTTKDEDACNE